MWEVSASRHHRIMLFNVRNIVLDQNVSQTTAQVNICKRYSKGCRCDKYFAGLMYGFIQPLIAAPFAKSRTEQAQGIKSVSCHSPCGWVHYPISFLLSYMCTSSHFCWPITAPVHDPLLFLTNDFIRSISYFFVEKIISSNPSSNGRCVQNANRDFGSSWVHMGTIYFVWFMVYIMVSLTEGVVLGMTVCG